MVSMEITCVAPENAIVKFAISPSSLPPHSAVVVCLLGGAFLGFYLKAYEVYEGVPRESVVFFTHYHQHEGQ